MSDAAALVPDLNEARRFLQALESGGRFQFQTFDDSKDKRQHLARTMYGTLDDHAATLQELNAAGAGVFVTVNKTDGTGRKASNVVGVRALFIDGDGIPLPSCAAGTCRISVCPRCNAEVQDGKTWHCEPSLIVMRDANHWHAYWLLAVELPLAEFTAAQKRLIAYYESDGVIHDLPRVMRLPGFWHRKGEPRGVRVTFVNDTRAYAPQIVLQGLPELPSSSVAGGGGFSRATVPPAVEGRKAGSKPNGPLTEEERAERYARCFLKGAAPASGQWNNALKDLVINLCSNFKCDDATVTRVALEWSRSVRAHDSGKEAEAQRTVRSVIDSCTARNLRGNKWRPPLEGRGPVEYDGHQTRIEGLEDGINHRALSVLPREPREVDLRGDGELSETDSVHVPQNAAGTHNPAGENNDRSHDGSAKVSNSHGISADASDAPKKSPPIEADSPEVPDDLVCDEPAEDDDAPVATEPDSLLPKLPRVPEGKVADWFNDTLDEELRKIALLLGTKRDAALIKLYQDIAARMSGVSTVTKARVKELVCDKLNINKRDYDRSLNECASLNAGSQQGSGGAGYIAYARAFLEYLQPRRAWKFWRQDWYEWTAAAGCYQIQEIKWVKAETGRWLSANGVDVTTKIQTDFLANLEILCIIHSDTKPGTWLGEDAWRDSTNAIYLSMKNGILNLRDRSKPLLEHTPAYFTLHSAPFSFDPAATCPKWEAAIEQWQPATGDGDATAMGVLWDWTGYLFWPGNPFKKFLINVGPGDDGKSIFSNVCRALVGEQNCCALGLEKFDPSNNFGLQPMLGKMLNVIGDANHVDKVAEGTLKSLTGNDPYTFDRKNKDAVTDVWLGKIIINANATPYWRERADALYNRMLPLKWETIPKDKMNPNLLEELKAELSGIFNWAMKGFDRLHERPFVIPPESNVWAWREEARGEAQHELGFFEQSIDYDKENLLKSSARCFPEDLMKHYKGYCELTNVKAFCNNVTLGKQLRMWLRRRLVSDGFSEQDVREFLDGCYEREKSSATGKRRWFYRGVILLEFENEQESSRFASSSLLS